MALLAAVNPKPFAADLLLIENARPRLTFACFLLGGMGIALAVSLPDAFVLPGCSTKVSGDRRVDQALAGARGESAGPPPGSGFAVMEADHPPVQRLDRPVVVRIAAVVEEPGDHEVEVLSVTRIQTLALTRLVLSPLHSCRTPAHWGMRQGRPPG
jgi:hypothetical protein